MMDISRKRRKIKVEMREKEYLWNVDYKGQYQFICIISIIVMNYEIHLEVKQDSFKEKCICGHGQCRLYHILNNMLKMHTNQLMKGAWTVKTWTLPWNHFKQIRGLKLHSVWKANGGTTTNWTTGRHTGKPPNILWRPH